MLPKCNGNYQNTPLPTSQAEMGKPICSCTCPASHLLVYMAPSCDSFFSGVLLLSPFWILLISIEPTLIFSWTPQISLAGTQTLDNSNPFYSRASQKNPLHARTLLPGLHSPLSPSRMNSSPSSPSKELLSLKSQGPTTLLNSTDPLRSSPYVVLTCSELHTLFC